MPFYFINPDLMPPADKPVVLPTRVMPFVWYFAAQVKWRLLVIITSFTLSSLLFSFLPYGIRLIVDTFGTGQGFDADALYGAVTVFGTIFLARLAFECGGDFLMTHAVAPLTNIIRRQLAWYVNKHSYRYFQDDFAGRIAAKVMDTPNSVQTFIITVCDQMVYAVSLVVGTAILFASVGSLYLGVIVAWVFLYALILYVMIPVISARSRIASKQKNIMRGRYVDVIVNILQVKLFARMSHEDTVMKEIGRQNANGYIARDRANFLMSSLIYLSLIGLYAGVLMSLVYQARHGHVTAGEASMILGGVVFIANSSIWVSKMFSELFKIYGEIYEGIDLITKAHDVQDDKDAAPITLDHGGIVLRDVTFTYPGRPVFDSLNLSIPAGQHVGLVGPSGAGKSTLIQIMLRLFDLNDGQILMDGQDIAHVAQDSLRTQIAVIPQMADLLHRSIRDNIMYGRLDATEAEMIAAAKQANAHDFILGLVDKDGNTGYDSLVGERGVKLSGGQRQRIAIARAILKDARVLLLDEATSALDSETEAVIQDSLFTLMTGRTAVVIAHRLSTIQAMDRLLVMKDGQIVEDGSHAELLAKGGYYASLWARQAGGFLKV